MWHTDLSKTEMGVQRSTKVLPISIPPPKKNNYVPQKSTILQNLRLLICVESLLAINRIYLLNRRKFFLFLSSAYCITFTILITFFTIQTETLTLAHFIFKYTLCIEYFLLAFIAVVTNKNKLFVFFKNLNKFDEILNISKDIVIVDSPYRSILWLCSSFTFHLIEYTLVRIYLAVFLDYSLYFIYIMTLAHDCEQIFFFTLLRNIYLRLRVLKAHVSRVFNTDENTTSNEKLSKVEALSKNIRLDVSSLHRVYDLLHKCSEQLNSLMSLPMILILLTSGLSTIMLMKMAVLIVQTMSTNSFVTKYTVIYILARCCKYTVLVVIPCYYSSITSTQVSGIRTVLHDAIHTAQLDKTERRKVKAFFLLTQENEFSYALGGVIRLNMSLPLSYMSLCTTYLVISIQFAKFFD